MKFATTTPTYTTPLNNSNNTNHNPKERKTTTTAKMKLLTLNFLSCAVKTCKSSPLSFPLHPKDAELAKDEVDANPDLLTNILPRLDWSALRTTAAEVRPCP